MADESPHLPDLDERKKAERAERDAEDARRVTGLLGLGFQLALTVAVFTGAGWWAEKRWGWTWGQQGLGFLGIVVGLYFFVKEATK